MKRRSKLHHSPACAWNVEVHVVDRPFEDALHFDRQVIDEPWQSGRSARPRVAQLLHKLLVEEFTKSRAHRTTDNALACHPTPGRTQTWQTSQSSLTLMLTNVFHRVKIECWRGGTLLARAFATGGKQS